MSVHLIRFHKYLPSLAAIFSITLLLAASTRSQTVADSGSTTDSAGSTFWSRRNISKISTGIVAGGSFAYGWVIWWDKGFRTFKFRHEDCYTNNICIDKIGHMYTSYWMFHTINHTLEWGGMPEDESMWWAAGVAAFHSFAIEVGDGFSYWGADPEDLAFNWTGVGFGILRKKVPFLANFEMKWSLFYPLEKHQFLIHQLQDYHIYWMSARVENLLPETWRPYWPDFLQVAVGFSGWSGGLRREYIVGLDYNLEELIPFEGKDINLIKRVLNMFHLPAPGIKFGYGKKPEFVLMLLN